jgi:hypothetical protein
VHEYESRRVLVYNLCHCMHRTCFTRNEHDNVAISCSRRPLLVFLVSLLTHALLTSRVHNSLFIFPQCLLEREKKKKKLKNL